MISLNLLRSNNILIETLAYNNLSGGERGDLPCIGHVGMCGPKGYGFCSRFGHNRVSNLAISSQMGYGFCSLVFNWIKTQKHCLEHWSDLEN